MTGRPYVTAASLDRKVRSWKRAISPYERHPYEIEAETAALIVVDVQRYFTERGTHAFLPAADAIIPRISSAVSSFRRHGRPVLFTRHSHRAGEEGLLGVWWKDTIRERDPLSALDPRLDLAGSAVIRKTRYSAFAGTGLARRLRHHGIRTLAIAGVLTHLCCETTARDAFVRDIQAVVLMDAMASDEEELHVSSLRTMADGFAEVLTCRELEGRLGW